MTYEIESNIPVPRITGQKGPPVKYPFTSMFVGQSFFEVVEVGDMVALAKARAKLSAAASSHSRRFPHQKFIVRTVNSDTEYGARVWRVS
jgi:hypothetical protein